jgi:hypothetical protein
MDLRRTPRVSFGAKAVDRHGQLGMEVEVGRSNRRDATSEGHAMPAAP